MNRLTFFILLLLIQVIGFAQYDVNHQSFNSLLKKYVDDKGLVDYGALLNDKEVLNKYLVHLSQNVPNDSWSDNQKLAYWINAYNAFTIDLILQHYPVKSIKDIGSVIQIPFVNSPWDIKFIKIGSETYDLNNIEHGIIREQFDEPRIHFALVCAAISCPKLLNEAFLPETLDAQLSKATREFLADKTKNDIKSESKAQVSKLFTWYRGDFTKKTTLAGFISQYSDIQLKDKAKISFMDYNWSLNEKKAKTD